MKAKTPTKHIILSLALATTAITTQAQASSEIVDNCADLSNALSQAQAGEVVYLKNNCTGNFTMNSNTYLTGVPGSNTTITGTVTVNAQTGSGGISHLTLTGAGSGIVVNSGVQNTFVISNNTVNGNSGNGIEVEGSDPLISNNTITDNSQNGVFVTGQGNPEVSNNKISSNIVNGVYIKDNNAGSPSYSSPFVEVKNNIVTENGNLSSGLNNEAEDSGIKVRASNGRVINNTVVNNADDGISYTDTLTTGYFMVDVYNNIVSQHKDNQRYAVEQIKFGGNNRLNIFNNLFYQNGASPYTEGVQSTGIGISFTGTGGTNVLADPEFINGDYFVNSFTPSPSIDMGYGSDQWDAIADAGRYGGTGVNMYTPEVTSTPVPVASAGVEYSYSIQADDGDNSRTQNPPFTPSSPQVLSYEVLSPSWASVDASGLVTGTPSMAGDYVFSVKISDGSGGVTFETWNVTVEGSSAESGDVVVSEVNWSGTGMSSGDEFIELYNNTVSAIDISGWIIENAKSSNNSVVLPEGSLIQPNDYFLISQYENISASTVLNVVPDVIDSLSLSNNYTSNGQLILKDSGDTIIDQTPVPESSSWTAGANADPDVSMARIDPEIDGFLASNWADSDRSLNIDSPFTFEQDGNTWTPGVKRNVQMTPGAPNFDTVICASTMHTNSGERIVDTTSECSEVIKDVAGGAEEAYMTYGPYISGLSVDQWYQVDFKVKIENITGAGTDPVFSIDTFVYPAGTLAFELFRINDVTEGGYATYSFNFKNPDSEKREFRVKTYNNADISIDTVMFTEIAPPATGTFTYESEDAFSAVQASNIVDTGASEGIARSSSSIGHIVYGPYSTEQTAGDYTATFYLQNTGGATGDIVVVDVYNSKGSSGNRSIVYKIVNDSELSTSVYTPVTLNFTRSDEVGTLEFRVKNLQTNEVRSDVIIVERV